MIDRICNRRKANCMGFKSGFLCGFLVVCIVDGLKHWATAIPQKFILAHLRRLIVGVFRRSTALEFHVVYITNLSKVLSP